MLQTGSDACKPSLGTQSPIFLSPNASSFFIKDRFRHEDILRAKLRTHLRFPAIYLHQPVIFTTLNFLFPHTYIHMTRSQLFAS